jgi:small GTP-binding protein
MTTNREIIKKICLLGDAAVGKTSLIKRYVYSMFDDKYITTIGTKVTKKSITYTKSAGGQATEIRLTLLIWDILGQKQYSRLHPVYYQGAEGALVVCDGSRPETISSIDEWAKTFQEVVGPVPLIFLINKADLLDQNTFNAAPVNALCTQYKARWMFSSAKDGLNVDKSFHELGDELCTRYLEKTKVA